MSKGKAEDLSELSVIGVDIGKDVFHLVGFDAAGNLVLRRRIKRALPLKPCRDAWSGWRRV